MASVNQGTGIDGDVAATHSVQELNGTFGTPRTSIPIDDMNQAIAQRGATAR